MAHKVLHKLGQEQGHLAVPVSELPNFFKETFILQLLSFEVVLGLFELDFILADAGVQVIHQIGFILLLLILLRKRLLLLFLQVSPELFDLLFILFNHFLAEMRSFGEFMFHLLMVVQILR